MSVNGVKGLLNRIESSEKVLYKVVPCSMPTDRRNSIRIVGSKSTITRKLTIAPRPSAGASSVRKPESSIII